MRYTLLKVGDVVTHVSDAKDFKRIGIVLKIEHDKYFLINYALVYWFESYGMPRKRLEPTYNFDLVVPDGKR